MPIGFILSGCIVIFMLFFVDLNVLNSKDLKGITAYKNINLYSNITTNIISVINKILITLCFILYMLSYINKYYVVLAIILSFILLSNKIYMVQFLDIIKSGIVLTLYSVLALNGYISSVAIVVVFLLNILLLFNKYIVAIFIEINILSLSIITQTYDYLRFTGEAYFEINLYVDMLLISIVSLSFMNTINKENKINEKDLSFNYITNNFNKFSKY